MADSQAARLAGYTAREPTYWRRGPDPYADLIKTLEMGYYVFWRDKFFCEGHRSMKIVGTLMGCTQKYYQEAQLMFLFFGWSRYLPACFTSTKWTEDTCKQLPVSPQRYVEFVPFIRSQECEPFHEWLRTNLPIIGVAVLRQAVRQHFRAGDGMREALELNLNIVPWKSKPARLPDPLCTVAGFPGPVVEALTWIDLDGCGDGGAPGGGDGGAPGMPALQVQPSAPIPLEQQPVQVQAPAPAPTAAPQPPAGPLQPVQVQAPAAAPAPPAPPAAPQPPAGQLQFDVDTMRVMMKGTPDDLAKRLKQNGGWSNDGTFMGRSRLKMFSHEEVEKSLQVKTQGGGSGCAGPSLPEVRTEIVGGPHAMVLVDNTKMWRDAAVQYLMTPLARDKTLAAMRFIAGLDTKENRQAVHNPSQAEGCCLTKAVAVLRRIHDKGLELQNGCYDGIFDGDNLGQRGEVKLGTKAESSARGTVAKRLQNHYGAKTEEKVLDCVCFADVSFDFGTQFHNLWDKEGLQLDLGGHPGATPEHGSKLCSTTERTQPINQRMPGWLACSELAVDPWPPSTEPAASAKGKTAKGGAGGTAQKKARITSADDDKLAHAAVGKSAIPTGACSIQPGHLDVRPGVKALAGLAAASSSHPSAICFWAHAAPTVRWFGQHAIHAWGPFRAALLNARLDGRPLLEHDFPNAPGASLEEKIGIAWCEYVALLFEPTGIDVSHIQIVLLKMHPTLSAYADAAAWVHCGAPFPLPVYDTAGGAAGGAARAAAGSAGGGAADDAGLSGGTAAPAAGGTGRRSGRTSTGASGGNACGAAGGAAAGAGSKRPDRRGASGGAAGGAGGQRADKRGASSGAADKRGASSGAAGGAADGAANEAAGVDDGIRFSFRHHRYWMAELDPVTNAKLEYHRDTVKFEEPEYQPLLRVLAGLTMRGLPRPEA